MKIYVGVTDNDWFRFLSQRADIDEVNFWQPSGNRQFRALEVGQPFLFKLHYPQHYIAGGGFFTHFSLVPVSLAWEAFGEKNGVQSLDEMRRRIEKYRHGARDARQDYTVGCIILGDPFFLPSSDWIPPPRDFAKNVVQGKTYDTESPLGGELWEQVLGRLRPGTQEHVREIGIDGPVFGDPVLVKPRVGQGTFRVLVTDAYQRRCAVTREKALPVLDAAHIRPVGSGGTHRIDNGLLLRSDVHTLFDRGYVTVTPDYRIRVSYKLKDDFDNGEHYLQLNGSQVWLPRRSEERPNPEFLGWHADTVYRG